MINRIVNIKKEIRKGKVLIVYGPRQVGKTTLVKSFLATTELKSRFVTGDDIQVSSAISECSMQSTIDFVSNYDLLVIDEAQKIPNIGLALKLMVDNFPNKYYLVTGSSSFDLANKTGESLTGRKNIVNLMPISQRELASKFSLQELKLNLEEYLIFGSYPEVINSVSRSVKADAVSLIANSYLLKDLFEYEGIKNSKVLLNILRLVAFQIGSEVSTTEIARNVGIDSKTVVKYLDLFEKSFILFRLDGYSRNLRKEINKMSKYYFYDTGIRNALINNFNNIESRDDIGKLWENFLFVERMKRNLYLKHHTNYYFWRTYDKQEIDLIEENSGKIYGYEFKWGETVVKAPKIWQDSYLNSEFELINRKNYLNFVGL